MARLPLLTLVIAALPGQVAAAEWPKPDRPSFTAVVRSAFRESAGMEAARSPLLYSGSSFIDQSIELTAYPHEALGLAADLARQVTLLQVDGARAPALEVWEASAGLAARTDPGVVLAEAHLGYAWSQFPSLVRGPGTPSSLQGPRFGLALVAPLPGAFALSTGGSLLLPFVSLDGRGDRGDGHSVEIRIGIAKTIASVRGQHLGVRLDFRQRGHALRGASGALISQYTSRSVGLSLVLAGIAEDAS